MILADHRDHRDMRRPAHRPEVLEHVARQLDNQYVVVLHLRQAVQQGSADVSADPGLVAGLQKLADHRGSGRFSLGAGDADDPPAGACSTKRRISVVIGTPASCAARRNGFVGGIAGDVTTRSADVKSLSRCSPNRKSIGNPASWPTESCNLLAGALSVTSTCAPAHQPPRHLNPAAKMAQTGDRDAFVLQPVHELFRQRPIFDPNSPLQCNCLEVR